VAARLRGQSASGRVVGRRSSFSPCGRRWREAPDEGLSPRRQTPHAETDPSSVSPPLRGVDPPSPTQGEKGRALIAMTAACWKHNFAFSRRIASELFHQPCRPQIKRAQGMPGAGWHPRSRVQCARGSAHTSIQVQPEQPGIPCAVGLRLIPRSPRRRIPFASVAGGLKILANPVGFATSPPA
jgi:hypothetical protein